VAKLFLDHRQSSLLLLLLIGFIFSFAISQGSVLWVYLSEIFPTIVRSKGQSIGSSAHWISNALISAAFPAMAARSMAYPFGFFAIMMMLQLLMVVFIVPETKGFSFEQIQTKLGID
jgi:MFS transporter, SP family, arabinose:H+ symporter